MSSELARNDCWQGRHDDPDNSGMCIYCGVILDAEPDEDPNSFRRSMGWIDMAHPHEPTDSAAVLAKLLEISKARGYTVEISEDGNEHKLIRPDGTVAVIARKTEEQK